MRTRLVRIITGLLLAAICLASLPAPAAAQDFGADGRLNPEAMEYYTVYCANDALDIYRGDGNLLNRVPIANLLGLSGGGSWDIGRGMRVSRYGDTIVVSGSNGNLAPRAGQKTFALSACVGRNGRSPTPISPFRSGTAFSAAATGGTHVTPWWPPTHIPIVTPQWGGRVHIVQPGENAFRIALAYGVSLANLATANNLVNVNRIEAGQILIIPRAGVMPPAPPAPPAPAAGTHVLLRGETLYRVALRYGVTVNALIAANGITDVRRIPAGTVLIIPAAG
jgi:LysM repeat protein